MTTGGFGVGEGVGVAWEWFGALDTGGMRLKVNPLDTKTTPSTDTNRLALDEVKHAIADATRANSRATIRPLQPLTCSITNRKQYV